MAKSDDLVSAACRYSAAGLPIFPVKVGKKQPATAGGGYKNAFEYQNPLGTPDSDIVEAWTHAGYNIGLACYSENPEYGILCIDLDIDPDASVNGLESLQKWCADKQLQLKDTYYEQSPHGYHLFYRVPGGREIKQYAGHSTNGVDIRTTGYAVIAPSWLPDGQYKKMPDSCEIVEMADADAAVYRFIEDMRPAAKSSGQNTTGGGYTVPEKVVKGGRNDALYKYGAHLRGKGLEAIEIRELMESFGLKRCEPPMSMAEIAQTVNSVMLLPSGANGGLGYDLDLGDEDEGKKPKKPPKHLIMAQSLISNYGACYIDGVPAIRDGEQPGVYHGDATWDIFDRIIVRSWPESTISQRKEVIASCSAIMPHYEQSHWTLIGFNNGVYDLNIGQFREYTHEDYILNTIPHDFTPNAHSDLLDSFLCSLVTDPETDEVDMDSLCNLYQLMGHAMLRSNKPYQFIVFLLGKGANGKSTFLGFLRNLVGKSNTSAKSPDDLSDQYGRADLAGKLLNYGADVHAFIGAAGCAILKAISGGDTIGSDVKYHKAVTFTPTCTLVFAANDMPRLKDSSDGMFRRIVPIELPNHFDLNNPNYDPLIDDKLTDESVMQAACCLAIQGLEMLASNHGYIQNKRFVKLKWEMAIEADSCLAWITDEGVTTESITGETAQHVYDLYVAWCKDSRIKGIYTKRVFIKHLREHIPVALTRIGQTVMGRRVRTFEPVA